MKIKVVFYILSLFYLLLTETDHLESTFMQLLSAFSHQDLIFTYLCSEVTIGASKVPVLAVDII